MTLHVSPRPPLAVGIAIADPAPADVLVRLHLSQITRILAGAVGDVDSLLIGHISKEVHRLVHSPLVRRLTHIDLVELIERAWDHGLDAARLTVPSKAP